MRPGRGKAQRSRQCRLYRAPPHILRDAGQFLVRRLFQGPRDRIRLESADPRLRLARGEAHRHRLLRRRRSVQPVAQDLRLAGGADHPHRNKRQFLGDGRHRPVRAVLGDLLRSRGSHPRRPARLAGRGRRPVHRDLESRVHAVRGLRQRRADQPAPPVGRHRHGARAHRRRPPGRARQLRHRPLPRPHPRQRRLDRRRSGRTPARLAPGHRRPFARVRLSGRRWRAAVERGARLCAPPHHAPRHAPRPDPRRPRSADVAPGSRADPRDGPGLSRTHPRRSAHRRRRSSSRRRASARPSRGA